LTILMAFPGMIGEKKNKKMRLIAGLARRWPAAPEI